MPKLTDTQTTLLAHAGKRDNGSVHPLPEALAGTLRAEKALTALIKRGLVEERETGNAKLAARSNDGRCIGIFVTAAGLTAIGISEEDEHQEGEGPAPAAVAPPPEHVACSTKAGLVLGLIKRDDGATLAELIEATGWLPHTTRAALTGLRKKGHAIERGKRDDTTCYRIAAAA